MPSHYDLHVITTWRKTRLAGCALVLSLALTGCIKLDMDLELEDGTASGEIVLAVSEEILDMTGGDESGIFDDAEIPEGATAEPYEEEGYVGQRYIFENTELTEFDDPDLSITYDEGSGRYEVNGVMDFAAEDAGDLPPEIAESFASSFDVSVSIAFPGEVIEHNGELDGNTVTWQPESGEVTELHAVAEEGSGSGLAWLWVALAVLAALAVIALVAVLSRRRGGSDDSPPEGAAHDATFEGDRVSDGPDVAPEERQA